MNDTKNTSLVPNNSHEWPQLRHPEQPFLQQQQERQERQQQQQQQEQLQPQHQTKKQEETTTTTTTTTTTKTIYGHLHMAKTAGTTLNGIMALKYNRVCGRKGYTNELRPWIIKEHLWDVTNFPEDCDWVSPELPHDFWNVFRNYNDNKNKKQQQQRNNNNKKRLLLELHIPCRETIDHLMSVVNHEGGVFDCDARDVKKEIAKYVMYAKGRFDYKKLSSSSSFDLKCFDYKFYLEYVDYMGQYLSPISSSSSSTSSSSLMSLQQQQQPQQQQQMEQPQPPTTTTTQEETSYTFRASNPPRNIQNECIWKDETLRKYVEEYLIENFDYYRYCRECIGSKDDLFSSLSLS